MVGIHEFELPGMWMQFVGLDLFRGECKAPSFSWMKSDTWMQCPLTFCKGAAVQEPSHGADTFHAC